MSELRVIETVEDYRRWRADQRGIVGFVPTMGALHAGHAALVERARRECARVVVSIFVNPTQFNDPRDLERYPRPVDDDLRMLRDLGADVALLPRAQEIYADSKRFAIHESETAEILCGPRRPGHFAGVLTVVMKLFNIVRPQRAYFGEKDYQQLRLISEMARAFFLDVEVVPCTTVREADGLAMSSRNSLLSATDRERAPLIYRALETSKSTQEAADVLNTNGFAVEYVEEHWGRRFVAANLGGVRLIDNVEL